MATINWKSMTETLQEENELLKIELAKLKEAKQMASMLYAIQNMVKVTDLTATQLTAMMDLYPDWEVGKSYAINTVVNYQNNLYKVVQLHTSQTDWTPNLVPALYAKVVPPTVIPLWVQPTGAHDAYALGAKVLFNSKVYESLIAANTYSPTAYPAGWKLIP